MFGRKKGAKGTKENPIVIPSGEEATYYVVSGFSAGPFATMAEAQAKAIELSQATWSGHSLYWTPPAKQYVVDAVAVIDPTYTPTTKLL